VVLVSLEGSGLHKVVILAKGMDHGQTLQSFSNKTHQVTCSNSTNNILSLTYFSGNAKLL
jgi:hypothetical protein